MATGEPQWGLGLPFRLRMVLVGVAMKTFLEVLTNIRIASAEIGGTVTFIFLIAFGMYKAWQEFVVRRSK